MVNQKHLDILKIGVENWNDWRRESFVVSNKIEKPNLGGANLSGANLKAANLSEANFIEADLSWADLSGAVLSGADLSSSNLIETNLSRCQVTNAKLDSALIGFTSFSNIDLTNVIGIDKCKHYSHSYIDYHTLVKSKNLPPIFLRGCGLSDSYIDSLPSLFEQAIQFYSCFISYSSKDEEFTKRLFADLQNNGIRCWYAPEHLDIGDKLRTTIHEAIKIHDKLLIVLSNDSLKNNWVEDEVEKAFEQERKQNKVVLFPIRIDDEIFDINAGWADSIRNTRRIGNFENWKDHDEYKKSFDKLVESLKIKK